MSLYSFGGLRLAKGIQSSFEFPAEFAIQPIIDPDDAAELRSIVDLGDEGVYFSICDGLKSTDATSSWLEMMSEDREGIIKTRLGRAVHFLIFDSRVEAGAIAFVDGGIETILKGSRQQCWSWFLDRTKSLWDCIDNPVLVW